MSYDRNAPQSIEITPARFFNLTRIMRDVEDDEDIIKHLTVVDSTMTAQVEALEEEERHIGRACSALLRDVNASLRRKNPMRHERMNHTFNSTTRVPKRSPSIFRIARDTGSLNLRGPALPGFKKRTPFRSTADG